MNTSFARATYFLWRREVLRFVRQKSRLIGALATPLMFWVLIGGGLQNSFRDASATASASGQGYFQFFFPGAISLSVLFTAIFSTISVIEDRHQGFLQGVLVSPTPRSALVLAKVLGGASLGLVQGLLLMALAPALGLHLGIQGVAESMVLLFLMASALTLLGFLFAWKIDSVQGYHSIMNMVLFPMWLLSGAVFPISGAHVVFRWLAKVNPLTYGVAAMREVFWDVSTQAHTWALAVLVLSLVSMGLFVASVGLVSRTDHA